MSNYAVLVVDPAKRDLLEQAGTCLIRRQFKQLCISLKSSEAVLYQSGRGSKDRTRQPGYFARAVIGDVFDHPTDPRHAIVFLEGLTYLKEPLPIADALGNGPEKHLFAHSGDIIGWHAARDLRQISLEEFAAIPGETQPAREEISEEVKNYDDEGDDIPALPLVRTRRHLVRDPKFARAIYKSYEKRCAISRMTMLSPDRRQCSLEAVRWYPFHREPRNKISDGGLLTPSWHARIDSGAVVIDDDYTWRALVGRRGNPRHL